MASRAIGLAVDTVGSYGREVIHGVMEFCHRNPHWVIAMEPRFWLYDEPQQPDQWQVDGLILQAYNQELVERVAASGIPTINVSNSVSNITAAGRTVATVVPDDAAIGRMAGEYLLSLGLRHFGFCFHRKYQYALLRRQGFESRLAEAGITCHDCNTADTDPAQWLAALPKPAAVFCSNDAWAHRLLSVARRCGIRVPEQLAVLGVDDDELLNTIGALPLSSIAIPAAKIGFEAARLLETQLAGGPAAPPVTTLPPLCVVPRATTDVTCVEDEQVAAALQFIKANVARPIQVDDVTDQLGISRRSLERRFRQVIGRSIALEIRRCHLERAKQLLTNTTLSVEEVAAASGFTNATLLGVVFRRHMNLSPTAFRQRSGFSTPKLAEPIPSRPRNGGARAIRGGRNTGG